MSRKRRRAATEARAAASEPASRPAWSRTDGAGLLVALALSAAAFAPILTNGFVNWDDPGALVHNDALDAPGVVGWAFTTRHLSHYQPLAWLAWAALRRVAGAGPALHHLASLLAHLTNTALVYLLALRLAARSPARTAVSFAAAAGFAAHPLRVEAVAWASAFPYVLALAPLLVSALAYLEAGSGRPLARRWRALALLAYGVSLLTRAAALGFPFALVALDLYTGRLRRGDPRWRRVLAEKLPYLALAVAAAVAEALARRFVSLERLGAGVRLGSAALAPFLYLWRTLLPVELNPLDALPLVPKLSLWAGLAGVLLLVAVTGAAVLALERAPAWAAGWLAYLALLGPAVGLTPTGLQATADRYTYLPGVILGLLLGALVACASARRAGVPLLAALTLGALGLVAITREQCTYWRDSRTLWTRALQLDPRNDVALYNLADALVEAGDLEGGVARLEDVVRLVPTHDLAKRQVSRLRARILSREAEDLAQARRLEAAVARYGQALELDPESARLHGGRGMALAELGRVADAVPDLEAALRLGDEDPALASMLAYGLLQAGRSADARRVLTEALARRPHDVGLAGNLARILATDADPAVRDPALALRLALEVEQATFGRDPRALDTLAAAYAASGDTARALRACARGVAAAQGKGDTELASAIEARARGLRRGR